ncbi:MAG: phosphate ABC transporter permease subunit PstC, partial [Acidobacteria bacterium]
MGVLKVKAVVRQRAVRGVVLSPSMANLRRAIDRLAHGVVALVALTAIVAIVLIFIFVFGEAMPIFTDSGVHQEVSLSKLFLPLEHTSEGGRFIWQPVGAVPKYSLVPLVIGTLKTTLVAVLLAAPLGIGAAIYTSEF